MIFQYSNWPLHVSIFTTVQTSLSKITIRRGAAEWGQAAPSLLYIAITPHKNLSFLDQSYNRGNFCLASSLLQTDILPQLRPTSHISDPSDTFLFKSTITVVIICIFLINSCFQSGWYYLDSYRPVTYTPQLTMLQ